MAELRRQTISTTSGGHTSLQFRFWAHSDMKALDNVTWFCFGTERSVVSNYLTDERELELMCLCNLLV